jgi:hypothetical protein
MSPRVLQRRQVGLWGREQLIDEAFARYLDWLTASDAVNAAYRGWSSAPRKQGALPFAVYEAALDAEERAATVYRSVIDRIEELFGGEHRAVGEGSRAARV